MKWAPLLLALAACCPAHQMRTGVEARWSANVSSGGYTYDQAVIELGPPERSTDIASGRVAVWTWSHGRPVHTVSRYDPYTNTASSNSYGGERTETLELVFDSAGVLRHYEWRY